VSAATITPDSVFKLAKLFRLQWEPAQKAHVLLYPEGMVKLNDSAGEIMTRIDGVKTVAEIVADLEQKFETTGLLEDVTGFMEVTDGQRWIRRQGD
jgi:pyrroloquinoline quinone biosynthesis protein D